MSSIKIYKTKFIIILVFYLLLAISVVKAQKNIYKGEYYPDSLIHNNKVIFKRDSSYYDSFNYYNIHDYSNNYTDSVWGVIYYPDIDSTYITFLYLKKEFWKEMKNAIMFTKLLPVKMSSNDFDEVVDSLYKVMNKEQNIEDCYTLCYLLLVSNTLDKIFVENNLKEKNTLYSDFSNKFAEKINIFIKSQKCRSSGVRTWKHTSVCLGRYNREHGLNLTKEEFFESLWNENDIRYQAIMKGYSTVLRIPQKDNSLPFEHVIAFYWLGDVIQIID